MVIDLTHYRKTREQRPPLQLVQYDDVRVEFARRVERAFFDQYEAAMEGNTRPSDTE